MRNKNANNNDKFICNIKWNLLHLMNSIQYIKNSKYPNQHTFITH